MGELTAVDLVLVAHACQDHAGRYFGGPFHFGRGDAVRYVAEGHLRSLDGRHHFATLCRAVRAYVDAHPEVLDQRLTDADVDAARERREAAAAAKDKEALAAYRGGDYELALRLLDEAELEAPAFADWERARRAVTMKGGGSG